MCKAQGTGAEMNHVPTGTSVTKKGLIRHKGTTPVVEITNPNVNHPILKGEAGVPAPCQRRTTQITTYR